MVQWTNNISRLTKECSNEEKVDKKIEILYDNSMLPISFQITIPSLVTDDYVSPAFMENITASREVMQNQCWCIFYCWGTHATS